MFRSTTLYLSDNFGNISLRKEGNMFLRSSIQKGYANPPIECQSRWGDFTKDDTAFVTCVRISSSGLYTHSTKVRRSGQVLGSGMGLKISGMNPVSILDNIFSNLRQNDVMLVVSQPSKNCLMAWSSDWIHSLPPMRGSA